jgi:tetratricopeptide (TPR) repeat protein
MLRETRGQKTRGRDFSLAGPPRRGSRPAIRRAGAAPAAKAGTTTPAPPPLPRWAGFRLDRGTILLVAGLLAGSTLPYLNILFNGFVYDDDFQIVQNPFIRSFQHLKDIFTANVWSFQGPTVSNYYRPMMMLGYLICYKIFGLRAYGFHLVSLLLHVLVVCLVFALTQRLTGDRTWAFVAGALFALHPVHSESVAWIAAVTDLELTFFYLITFGLFLALARPGGRTSAGLLAVMGATFIPALLSKEQAMTLPALATVYEHFYPEDRSETSTSQKLARYGVLWLVGAAYLLVRLHFLGGLAPEKKFGQITPLQTVLSAVALVGQYVWKLVWPVRLCAYYIFHPSTSPFDLRVLGGLAVLVALAGLFWVCWRSRERNVRFASFAILWFLATLAPVLNAHWVGDNVFTERYLYLPSVGVAWLVGLGATKLWSRAAVQPARRRALALVGVTVGMLYAARIVIRDRDWNNDIVLYTRTTEIEPEPHMVLNLGVALNGQGRIKEAMEQFYRALRLKPGYPEPYNDLGLALAAQGRIDEADAQFAEALRLKPDFPEAHNNLGLALAAQGRIHEAMAHYSEALRLKPGYPEPHNNLGLALAAQGRIDEAIAQYSEALRLQPDYSEAHNNLGHALDGQGRINEAVAQYSEALRLQPDYPDAHNNLGTVLARQGRIDEAVAQYSEALRLQPDFPAAHFNLGNALARQGRIDEAVAQFSEALRIKPYYPEAHNHLGLALAAQGKTKEAVAQYSEALRLKPDYPEAHYNLGLALDGQGTLKEAVAQYAEALRLKPDYPEAHNNLGTDWARQGRIDEAVAQYSEALRLKPDFLEAHFNLAIALARQGRIDEAIGQCSAALHLQPDFPQARRLLSDLISQAKSPDPAARYRPKR